MYLSQPAATDSGSKFAVGTDKQVAADVHSLAAGVEANSFYFACLHPFRFMTLQSPECKFHT